MQRSLILNWLYPHDSRKRSIKAAALKWKSEIHYWLGLEIKPSQTPVEICNKLLVKLGLKGEAIARPGTVGKRDRIYQVSGVADPCRDRLLEAARLRLTEADQREIQRRRSVA